MPDAEYHVASFVVHSDPAQSTGINHALAAISGVDVHAEQHGKFVVTAEGDSVRTLADISDSIQSLPGVIAVAPVYHEFTSEDAATTAAENQPDLPGTALP